MINIHSSEVIVAQILMCLLFSCWLQIDQILIFNKHCHWFNLGTLNIDWGTASPTIFKQLNNIATWISSKYCIHWEGWEGSRLALFSWCFECNIWACCKGDAAVMGARLWEKEGTFMARKLTMKCSLQSPYFLIILNYCSVLFLSWHLPNWLSKFIDMLVVIMQWEEKPTCSQMRRVPALQL